MQSGVSPDSLHYREDATGHMLCWGCGEFGQHGHGYKKEVSFLDGAVERFCGEFEHQVKHVGCGSSHTAVVTNSNELYLWGNGNSGQLGTTDLTTKLEPQKLPLYSNKDLVPAVAGVSCGGRHTMVWLENGHVFSFGNNFHAQLGYDFRQKNYKENQSFWDDDDDNTDHCVTQPTLLKFLSHKPVAQVACGDKHTIFRFQDGGVACVGNNAHGQIGTGDREEAAIPKFLEALNQPIKTIAAGSQHSLAITESGEIYAWGYGRACGNKTDDILEPVKLTTHRNNVIAVAGGSTHSMALTANGSVYTWGYGHDGQLGHGEKVKFLSSPKRVKDRHVIKKCIQISCGEAFSAAVTEKGLLYMWGKNSHTILPDKPTSQKLFLPHGVNKNFRGGRISKIYCGSWHAIAIIGRPGLLLREETESGESADEEVQNGNDVGIEQGDDNDEEELSDWEADLTSPSFKREPTMLEREKTTVSIADFYAPTPDINKSYRSPSPEFYFGNENGGETDRNNLNSTRSAATLIVQLPVQPMTSYADAATSPMTLTTTSSTKSSSVTTLSRVPSPIQEISNKKYEKPFKRLSKPEKKFKEFDPQKYEREKLRSSTTPVSEVVQLSKTPADAFFLPHETTGLSKKHVDFSEMEEIRLKGPRSPEKLSRLSRHRDSREPSPSKFRESSPIKLRESMGSVRSRHRYLDSSLSLKSEITLMESPLFKGSKKQSIIEKAPRLPETPYTDDRQYTHHVPKQQPRKFAKPQPQQVTDSNFGLQISRSRTVIAPVQVDSNDPSDRLAQLRRYAAIHNPASSSGKGSIEKLRPIKNRHVSIPGVRAESPDEEREQLCIGGAFNPKDKPVFSSGSTWRDRSDFDRLPPRKMAAAGIVKMYIGNHDIVGTMENPLYTSISDGSRHSDPIIDSETLIVQPLLKKKVKHSNESINLELPSIAINQTPRGGLNTTKLPDTNLCNESEELDLTLTNTSRTDKLIGTRVS